MTQVRKSRNNLTRRGRFEGYDYRSPGYYFLTICHSDRRMVFGHVQNDLMHYSPAGHMLVGSIEDLGSRYQQMLVDAYAVMPNHVHLLLGNRIEPSQEDEQVSIPEVMDWWKTVTTKRYITSVRNEGWEPFQNRLWQSGYHDRTVRTERELNSIRNYIAENPKRWAEDTFYGDDWESTG